MSETCDVIIVGGGPAALAAAIYTGRAELKTVIYERMWMGGQVAQTDAVDNYPGFPEGVAGPALTQLMVAQARRFGADVRNEEVSRVELEGLEKVVTTPGGSCRAPALILAMGADPRKLGVPGEEELRGKGVSYCGTCDAPFFRGKRVVCVGGGDTALKEGLFLAKFVSQLIVVHRRREFRAERIYQTEIHNNPKAVFELDSVVERINGADHVTGVELRNVKTGATGKVACDGVFVFIGTVPNTHFLANIFKLDEGGHIATDADMMSSVPGIFAVGDVRKGSYRQVATAVGEGATAGIAAEEWISDNRAKGLLRRGGPR